MERATALKRRQDSRALAHEFSMALAPESVFEETIEGNMRSASMKAICFALGDSNRNAVEDEAVGSPSVRSIVAGASSRSTGTDVGNGSVEDTKSAETVTRAVEQYKGANHATRKWLEHLLRLQTQEERQERGNPSYSSWFSYS